MARVNIYLPDELAAQARAAELNVSGIAQKALRDELARAGIDRWLETLERRPPVNITTEQVLRALDEVREESGDTWPG
jgi:post-segregation antitoxin (ccd killing protein)